MKRKIKDFWLKLIWPTKKAGKARKKQLVFMKGNMYHEGEKKGFLTKTDRGSPSKKAGKSPKKRNLCL